MGDAGATALADALQATVLTCGTQRSRNVHLVATDVALQGDLSSWRRRVVVQFVFFFLVSRRKTSRGVECCSRVVLKLMWHGSRIELDQLSVSLLAFAWLRSVRHIVSSGPWRRLANDDRGVVCQGMTCPGRTWHYASKKQAGRWTQYNMLFPERMSCCFQFEVARTLTGPCDPNGLVG